MLSWLSFFSPSAFLWMLWRALVVTIVWLVKRCVFVLSSQRHNISLENNFPSVPFSFKQVARVRASKEPLAVGTSLLWVLKENLSLPQTSTKLQHCRWRETVSFLVIGPVLSHSVKLAQLNAATLILSPCLSSTHCWAWNDCSKCHRNLGALPQSHWSVWGGECRSARSAHMYAGGEMGRRCGGGMKSLTRSAFDHILYRHGLHQSTRTLI